MAWPPNEDVAGLLVEERADRVVLGRSARITVARRARAGSSGRYCIGSVRVIVIPAA